jgi:hypothetical protein
MNDQELRAIVRQAIHKQLGSGSGAGSGSGSVPSSGSGAAFLVPSAVGFGSHASHAIYMQVVNDTGACVIEPSVPCDHCGYCKSHGH